MFDVERERKLDREYGRRMEPSVYYMFDNHTFRRVSGTASEMADLVLKCMEEDHFCGYLAVSAWADGPTIADLSFHGDYGNHSETRERIARWKKQMEAFLGE